MPQPDDRPISLSRRQVLGIGASIVGAPLLSAGRADANDRIDVHHVRSRPLGGGFAEPIGNWLAGDIPHINPLPDGRNLWLLNDSFIGNDSSHDIADAGFVRNAAVVQDGHAFSLVNATSSFHSDGESTLDRWWWFHGSVIDGNVLRVITTEMVRIAPLGWAINFEPRSTWITSIDWSTNAITAMSPAPNAGVLPVYGFSIASDSEWTYLYGNNHLYGRQTTDNRVARVPRGQLLESPEYWTNNGWSTDASRATSILSHGEYACRLNVMRHGDRWIATAKDDEFRGTDVLIFEAPGPIGPWELRYRFTISTKTGDDRSCTYDAMAHSLNDTTLLVWWSNNAYSEDLFRSEPEIYRPTFTLVDLPRAVGYHRDVIGSAVGTLARRAEA